MTELFGEGYAVNMAHDLALEKLKEIIKRDVFIIKDRAKIVAPNGDESSWLFDFRNILLKPEPLDLIAELFWKQFESKYPFQVGGQESAAIPLVAAIVMKSKQKDKPVNGFFIRKSRKKDGLQSIVEGELTGEKIILIDDLLNSGRTINRQIEVLESMGKNIDTIFVLLGFRDLNKYSFIKERGINLISALFLTDFGFPLLDQKKDEAVPKPSFNIEWHFQSPNPNYFYVVPKSSPIIDDKKIYFGSDSGYFWALNQEDGTVAWKYKVGWHAKGKSIFSAPALHDGLVYFGSYDGNVYALDTATGKRKWVFMEADWVGSSPCLAPDLGLLFIGLEFGLFKKRGGIAALNLKTGEKIWEYSMTEYAHSSPAYLASRGVAAIGGNDATAYLFRAKDGKLLWNYKAGGEIKASFAFDESRNLLLFGSFDGNLYALNLDTGRPVFTFQTLAGIYSTPLACEGRVYVSSLDKKLYCLDLERKGELVWSFDTGARIFSSPVLIEGHIFAGANDGRLYEIDANSGKLLGFFQALERITSPLAYNAITKRFFLPTYANEVYCFTRTRA